MSCDFILCFNPIFVPVLVCCFNQFVFILLSYCFCFVLTSLLF